MLQQTQVDTVIPYFHRFLEKFPSLEVLAKAPIDDVLKTWEGLGYYSRARNLQKAAKCVLASFNGNIPDDYMTLQSLPGLGPYCAAAIASIAFGKPIPVVDGNVLRVMSRFWGIESDIRHSKTRVIMFNRLKSYIETTHPSLFNQGMMELGALICKPKSPKCGICPISSSCFAFKTGQIDRFPVKSKKSPVPHYDIGVGLIWKDNYLLIAKRKEDQMLGGLWEFPGGKKKEKETIEETVLREIKEETALHVKLRSKLGVIKHAYSHFKITLHAFHCLYENGEPFSATSQELRWVTFSDLKKYPFPSANKKMLGLMNEFLTF